MPIREPLPGQPTVEDFDTAERQHLAEASRELITAILTTERADATALRRAREAVAAITAELNATEPNPGARDRWEGTHTDYLPRSPVVGSCSPLAPPVEMEMVGEQRLIGTVTFGAPFEGPPGYVHGGVLALVFDEMLGMVNVRSDHPGMTAVLTTKYRRPTPLDVPVALEAWVERIEGRKAITRGQMKVDGALTAEVEGLFVTPDMDRIIEYFGPREPAPDPLP